LNADSPWSRPPTHRANRPGIRIERHQGDLEPLAAERAAQAAVGALEAIQPATHRALGGPLKDWIERRVDPRAPGPKLGRRRRSHVIEKVRSR